MIKIFYKRLSALKLKHLSLKITEILPAQKSVKTNIVLVGLNGMIEFYTF